MSQAIHPIRFRSLQDPDRRAHFILENTLGIIDSWRGDAEKCLWGEPTLKSLSLVSRDMAHYTLPFVFKYLIPISPTYPETNPVIQKLTSGTWSNARQVRYVHT